MNNTKNLEQKFFIEYLAMQRQFLQGKLRDTQDFIKKTELINQQITEISHDCMQENKNTISSIIENSYVICKLINRNYMRAQVYLEEIRYGLNRLNKEFNVYNYNGGQEAKDVKKAMHSILYSKAV